MALHKLLQDTEYRVKGLFSTTSAGSGRLPVHEVKSDLIRRQAREAGLPLHEVQVPDGATNEAYEAIMHREFESLKKQGIHTIAYADLLLEDIKAYRDEILARTGMNGLYPLWKKDTSEVAAKFIDNGFQAIVTTVDSEKLPADMAGKCFNKNFIESLPEGVDPAGENGEFHTFVFNGPIFKNPIPVKKGRTFRTFSGRFVHTELIYK